MEKILKTKLLGNKSLILILFITLFSAIFSQVSLADDTNLAKNMLQEKFNDLITVLKNKEVNDEVKKGQIDEIIKPIFDFPLMSKLALGKTAWRTMTTEDQERFYGLFTKLFEQTYLEKILDYADEDITFGETEQNGRKVCIHSCIVSKDKETSIVYKLYQADTGWKIYDVDVEGVSYIQTYRSQFTESLKEKIHFLIIG